MCSPIVKEVLDMIPEELARQPGHWTTVGIFGERSKWALFRKELQNIVKYRAMLLGTITTHEERVDTARSGRSPWWPVRIEAWGCDVGFLLPTREGDPSAVRPRPSKDDLSPLKPAMHEEACEYVCC